MLFIRKILLPWLCLALLASCGTEVNRTITPIPPSFSISPPDSATDSLQIKIIDQVDDAGAHSLSISADLNNSAGSTGNLWSDFFASSFQISFGDLKLSVPAAKGSPASNYSLSTQSISISQAEKIFASEVKLLSSEGAVISSLAETPEALSNLSVAEDALSLRLIAPCKFKPTDDDPELYWEGQNSNNLKILFGAKAEFSNSVTDDGYWEPLRSLFEKFFSAADLASADSSKTTTATITTPLVLQRSSNASVRVFKSGVPDRSLIISMLVEERRNTQLRYVGACI